jgi:hypothetical protein
MEQAFGVKVIRGSCHGSLLQPETGDSVFHERGRWRTEYIEVKQTEQMIGSR